MKITLGNFTFPSKAAAINEIRRIKDEYPLNSPLVGDDAELMLAVLGNHHDREAKIGSGVAHISVRRIEHGARGFWITRIDGTCDDFSYKTALNGELSHEAQVKRAMRSAIDPVIRKFKDNQFASTWGTPPGSPDYDPDRDPFDPENLWAQSIVYMPLVCALTGNQLTNDASTHVDHHDPTFAELAAAFASENGGFADIPIKSSTTHPGPALCEPTRTKWIDYHERNASLRLIHRSANLARAKFNG